MNCDSCTHHPDPVPYIVHESAMARQERTIRRVWILVIIVFALFVVTNAAWIFYESQFEDVYTEITQENENGYNNYIGNDGDINNYGETDYQEEDQNP